MAILDSFHFEVTEPALPSNHLEVPNAEGSVLLGQGKETGNQSPRNHGNEEEIPEEPGQLAGENKTTPLSEKIYQTVTRQVLPTLLEHLTRNTDPASHRLGHRAESAEANMLRVPVAMATTKLLLQFPESALHAHLPGYVMLYCNVGCLGQFKIHNLSYM